MAVKPVVLLPARVLSEPARLVGDDDVRGLVTDLIDTMRASPACVGLAAPQIGVPLRVFVLDVSAHPKTTDAHGLVALIDPVVEAVAGRARGREGCMSVPDLTADVVRAERVVVRGLTPDGEERVVETSGFEARAIQHEIDHLDGLVILDRVASLATDVFRRKVYR
ncbi:MAG: peptide deformylase [Actinomycetota bacterium]|nr:peptide deformylase [Actinomycetota bacterium]